MAIGASESSVRRWVDSGRVRLSRTVGGHRRITVAEAVRFIREMQVPLLRPELLGLPKHVENQPSSSRYGASPDAALAAALEAGDAQAFRSLALSWYIGGGSIADLFDGPVRDTMGRIGGRWRAEDAAILTEHRATEVCAQAVAQLRMLMPPAAQDAPLALGGAVEGDAHALASLLAATVLADAGYREVNFGGSTPVRLLSRAAAEQRPRLVWVSVNAPIERRLARAVESLSEQLHGQGAALVAGGLHAGKLPAHGNLHVARSMSELSAFAQGLLRAVSPPKSP